MSELTDLNATGNGLSAVSGGLQGLLEAYKMKMSRDVEQAKLSQAGLDAGANARAMASYRWASLGEKTENDAAARATAAFAAGQTADGGPTGASVAAREILAGRLDPNTVPKRGAFYSQLMQELDKQSQGNPDLLNRAEAAKSKMFEASPTAQRVQRSGDAMVSLVNGLKSELGYNPKTGAYDKPSAQSDYPAANKIKSAFGYNIGGGDPRKNITAYASAIQDELKMLSANSSDKNLALAANMVNPDAPRGDLIKGLDMASKAMVGGRSTAYGGVNPFGSNPASQQAPPAGPLGTLRAALPGASPAPAPAAGSLPAGGGVSAPDRAPISPVEAELRRRGALQ